jgi:hypothetical protein
VVNDAIAQSLEAIRRGLCQKDQIGDLGSPCPSFEFPHDHPSKAAASPIGSDYNGAQKR